MGNNMLPIINMKATGGNIKRLRRENGYTIRELQGVFNFNEPQTIYKWQRGDCLPTVENLLVLSHLFKVNIEGILIYDEVPFPYVYNSKLLKSISRLSYMQTFIESLKVYDLGAA